MQKELQMRGSLEATHFSFCDIQGELTDINKGGVLDSVIERLYLKQ